MDIDEVVQKLIRWLSDPKGREAVKTIIYVVFPLIVLLALRNATRRRPVEKVSRAIEPRIRATSATNLLVTESLQETRAKERQKIKTQLAEVFGRERSLTARSERDLTESQNRQTEPASDSPASHEKEWLQEQLLKLFSRRQR